MNVAIFADLPSIYDVVKRKFKGKLDYGKILNLFEDDYIIRAYAYSTKSQEEAGAFYLALEHLGYIPKFASNQDWHVEFTLDVVKIVKHVQKIIFITNDYNYEYLFQWCRHEGIFVHLICFDYDSIEHEADKLTIITPSLLEAE